MFLKGNDRMQEGDIIHYKCGDPLVIEGGLVGDRVNQLLGWPSVYTGVERPKCRKRAAMKQKENDDHPVFEKDVKVITDANWTDLEFIFPAGDLCETDTELCPFYHNWWGCRFFRMPKGSPTKLDGAKKCAACLEKEG